MQAAVSHDKADLDRMKADYKRAEQLFNEKLGAKQDFEDEEVCLRCTGCGDRRIAGARGAGQGAARTDRRRSLHQHNGRSLRPKPILTRFDDILRKHNAYAPIDGVVDQPPVRMGESVVPGIQNSKRQHHHDNRRHVGDYGGSEGG